VTTIAKNGDELVVSVGKGGLLQKGLQNLSKEELLTLVRESTTSITNKGIVVNTLDAATANQQFTGIMFKKYGFNIDFSKINPPHAPLSTGINDFKLLENKLFVRVYPEGSEVFGIWLISMEDFRKFKSLQEIKNKLALPGLPAKFSIAEIPAETIIRESKAAKVITNDGTVWGEGGATQYMIQNHTESTTKEWFKEVGNISEFIK
jgi:hypothetical protein